MSQPPAALPPRLDAVRTAVATRLPQVLDGVHARWAGLDPALGELVGPARDLTSGGKRMRAVLGSVGYAVARCTASGAWQEDTWAGHLVEDPAVRLGAALELYQASALVHDDYMDAAPVRRGAPAAHVRYAALHAERAWTGDATAFGAAGAILLGDLLLSVAGEEMDGAVAARAAQHAGEGTSPDTDALLAARRAFDVMTAEVAVGQYLDARSQVLPLGSWPGRGGTGPEAPRDAVEQALEVVRHKSARYSVVHPLLIGAALGGLPSEHETVELLRVMGEWTGTAFQLRDDELGVFGDPAVTGKPAGDDLREGKRTALVALTRARADGAGVRLLDDVLGDPSASERQVGAVRALMVDCGAYCAHEDLIALHADAGLAVLATTVPDSPDSPGSSNSPDGPDSADSADGPAAAAADDGVLGEVALADLRLLATSLVARNT